MLAATVCLLIFVTSGLSSTAACAFEDHEDIKNAFNARGHHKPFGHHAKQWKRLRTVYEHPHPETFYNEFVRPSKPLVIKGGAADWPAVKKWKDISYINEISGDELHTVNWKRIYNYDRHHAIRVDMTMKEFTKKFNRHDLYMDSTIPNSFHGDVHWPHSLGCKFFVKRVKQLAIMMNNGRSRSDVHIDATDTYFMQVTGKRLWLLMPPSSVTNVYSGHPHLVDHSGVSVLNQTHMDFEKHPKASKLDIYAALLYPGDIIYVPEGWYHQVVTNGSPNIAIVAFLNILFCEYHNKHKGDVTHVRTCVDSVRERKPRTLKCQSFPKKPISIAELLRLYNVTNKSAFKESPTEFHNKTERILRYAKRLPDGSWLPTIGVSLNGMTSEALRKGLVLNQAIYEGHTLYGTSPNDGSEEALGEFLQRRPPFKKRISILSHLDLKHGQSPSSVATSIDASLNNLNVSVIDFLLLRAPYCSPDYQAMACTRNHFQQSWVDVWKALETLQRQGKIRYLGVSDFSLAEIQQLAAVASIPITIARARFDLYFRNRELRHYCKKNNIMFMARSVLGLRWKKENPNCPLNRDIFSEYCIHRAAYQYKVSIHAILYDWAIKKNVIVMPRVNHPLHVRINIKAIDSESNELTDHMYTMDELDPDDDEGLFTPYSRISDFKMRDVRNKSETVNGTDFFRKKATELDEMKSYHDADFSEQTYTDDKDFEIFPAYMTDN